MQTDNLGRAGRGCKSLVPVLLNESWCGFWNMPFCGVLSLCGLLLLLAPLQSDAGDDDDSPVAMQAIGIHSKLAASCSPANWIAQCTAIAALDEKVRSLVDQVKVGRLSEEEARVQLREARAQTETAIREISERQKEEHRQEVESRINAMANEYGQLVDARVADQTKFGPIYNCYYKRANGEIIMRQRPLVCPNSFKLD